MGDAADAKSPRCRKRLTTIAGKRRLDLGIRQVVFGGLKRVPGVLDRLLLDLDEQLELADLVVASFRKVNALGCLLFRLLGSFECSASDVDLRSRAARAFASGLREIDLRAMRSLAPASPAAVR